MDVTGAIGMDKNSILAKLSKAERAGMAPHFEEMDLVPHDILHDQKAKIDRVYLPLSGMISILLLTKNGAAVETGFVDREGVAGGSVVSAGDISFGQHFVQMGGTALTITTSMLRELCAKNQTLRSGINNHQSIILLQAQHSAACHALHNVSERLCRWLLHSHDVAEADEFFLTQEFLAHMLGVTRTSVSLQANQLQAAELISYSRGHVKVLDRAGLEEASCECYAAIRACLKPEQNHYSAKEKAREGQA